MTVKGTKKQTDRHVEAVLAACDIIGVFLNSPNQTLKQIIEKTGLTRNRVMRLAGTLEGRGFLHRDPRTGSYGLGTMFMSLGRVYERQSSLSSLGQPLLQELARATGESASIYVLDSLERVVLAREEGKQDVRLAIAVGQRTPIPVGASGKVLLAFGPKEVRDHVLNGRRSRKEDAAPIADPSKLADELDRIRTQGYACSFGERVADAGAVAAPLFGLENRFLGALGIAGPIHRFTPETLPGKIELVMRAAAQLTWQLGGFPASPSAGGRIWDFSEDLRPQPFQGSGESGSAKPAKAAESGKRNRIQYGKGRRNDDGTRTERNGFVRG
ncbi:MAG: HTH-type transcriptional regulator KipR [Syntrophaceae bacterium PtaU1.Bin231]|nr:MAG: HTH-type transcriptional regulator KipR [Syntrophaceae bacterium PtaU1.Bin231]